METNKKTAGFTLVELMIVVAVLGILAAAGIMKYGNMLRKSREANARGSLGALRSALSIYYSDNEGNYPSGTAGDNQPTLSDALIDKYLKEMPTVIVYPHHSAANTVDNVDNADFSSGDNGEWTYVANPNSLGFGIVAIECTHTDTKNLVWTSY